MVSPKSATILGCCRDDGRMRRDVANIDCCTVDQCCNDPQITNSNSQAEVEEQAEPRNPNSESNLPNRTVSEILPRAANPEPIAGTHRGETTAEMPNGAADATSPRVTTKTSGNLPGQPETSSFVPGQPRKDSSTPCFKCKESPADVIANQREPLCGSCLHMSLLSKFKTALGKTATLKPNEKVLIAFSGGPSSRSVTAT